jgi:hypothetical protein
MGTSIHPALLARNPEFARKWAAVGRRVRRVIADYERKEVVRSSSGPRRGQRVSRKVVAQTSRRARDPRMPADFFCFAPTEKSGFWERERKRRPYSGLVRDFLAR